MKQLLLLLASFITLSCTAQDIPDSKTRDIVITNVSVIPMDKETVLADQAVVVKNGRISALGEAKKIKYNNNSLVIDGKGKFLIPGLAEMHAHVPPIDEVQPINEVMLLFVANGVTTIRGMLGHPRHIEVRDQIRNGMIPGPRFYTSGPSLNGSWLSQEIIDQTLKSLEKKLP